MKPGPLTFPMVPICPEGTGAASSAGLTSLIRLLMGLDDWPEDHGILVHSRRHRAPLAYARVATSRHVVEILFDPETGRYDCMNCQSIGVDLPAAIATEPEGRFIGAVIRGLTAAAAAALLQGAMAVLERWADWASAADAAVLAHDDCCPLTDDGIAVRRKPAV
ncbi:hypothetical protein CDL60_18315 [Roseateles noduli]|nr:hypothetical protein CDL60_18315 [Roseateles noduli]